ncbi:hypothetical protein A3J78_01860 [Candidatus Beckwithbacteria bacterium RBG_13_35_6]|uniref:Large ribosomal subunit protein bL35 n=1 Tax=Candidatus Beckwithbacteria bacterium RBG_13_35_6 TaxID=1797456 RepID=A0A1F5DHJ4_9BACT|nr:MAG: hypothetical protein A3J78_01860 [Candidatus Beckwithbacteria bacterium RBG_13_35_6]
MPKQKTRKSIAKRFRVTKTGKVLRRGSYGRHLKASKSKKRLRRQKVMKNVKARFAIKIKKALS